MVSWQHLWFFWFILRKKALRHQRSLHFGCVGVVKVECRSPLPFVDAECVVILCIVVGSLSKCVLGCLCLVHCKCPRLKVLEITGTLCNSMALRRLENPPISGLGVSNECFQVRRVSLVVFLLGDSFSWYRDFFGGLTSLRSWTSHHSVSKSQLLKLQYL